MAVWRWASPGSQGTFQNPGVERQEVLGISMGKGWASVCSYVGFSERKEQPPRKQGI